MANALLAIYMCIMQKICHPPVIGEHWCPIASLITKIYITINIHWKEIGHGDTIDHIVLPSFNVSPILQITVLSASDSYGWLSHRLFVLH